jgi:hypothetical protein
MTIIFRITSTVTTNDFLHYEFYEFEYDHDLIDVSGYNHTCIDDDHYYKLYIYRYD